MIRSTNINQSTSAAQANLLFLGERDGKEESLCSDVYIPNKSKRCLNEVYFNPLAEESSWIQLIILILGNVLCWLLFLFMNQNEFLPALTVLSWPQLVQPILPGLHAHQPQQC